MKMQSAFFFAEFNESNQIIILDEKESHHAISVRRVKLEEEIHITNGLGLVATGRVVSLKQNLQIAVHQIKKILKSKNQITVAQAILKSDRSDLAVELMTEVGVGHICFWAAERSVAKIQAKKEKSLQRWKQVATSAIKQSRQAWLPEISYQETVEQLFPLIQAQQAAYLLDYEATLTLSEVSDFSKILFIVGPEGGMTEQEKIKVTSRGVNSINIGSSVLRGSTAGAIAVAVAHNFARSQND